MSTNAYIKPYKPAPTSGPVVVWPIGDSIVNGGTFGGWRPALYGHLTELGKQPNFVGGLLNSLYNPAIGDTAGTAHNGNNGSAAGQWIGESGYFSVYLGSAVPSPTHIIIALGANGGDSVANGEAIGALIDLAVTAFPRALIMVQNAIVQSTSNMATLNAEIASQVASRRASGVNVRLVDMNPIVPVDELVDGLHPSVTGFSRMAAKWKLEMEAVV